MRHRYRLIGTLCAALLCSGCSLLFPGHPASEYTKNERLELLVAPSDHVGQKACAFPQAMAALSPQGVERFIAQLAPGAAGLLVDQTSRAIQKQAERFEAAYSITRSGEFYQAPPRYQDGRFEASLALGKFALERSASKQASLLRALLPFSGARGDSEKTAAFDFEVVPSTCGDAFQVVLTSAYVKRSKAKVFDPRWENHWWTRIPLVYGFFYDLLNIVGVIDWGDGAIDLELEVGIEAVWVDSKRQGRHALIGSFRTKLSDVEIGSDCEIPEFSSRTRSAPASDCSALRPGEVRSTGWIPAFPRSAYKQEAWGLGNYILTLKVSEFDDFSETVARAGEALGEQREVIVERVRETVREDSEEE